MAKRQARTLLEVCVARMGPLKGGRVLTYMIAWRTAEKELGEGMTLLDYAEWWKESERTAYREQARFRECFPGEADPGRIMREVEGAWEAKRGVRGLGAVPLNAVPA